jgi:hypothetical protein
LLGAGGGLISYAVIFWFPWFVRMATGKIKRFPDRWEVAGLMGVAIFAAGLGGLLARGLLGDVTAGQQALIGGLAWPGFIKAVGDIADEAGIRLGGGDATAPGT